jgi:hypothetical protein
MIFLESLSVAERLFLFGVGHPTGFSLETKASAGLWELHFLYNHQYLRFAGVIHTLNFFTKSIF